MGCWPEYRDSSSISPCFNYTRLSRSKGKGIYVDRKYIRSQLKLPTHAVVRSKYVKTKMKGKKCQCYEDLCNSPYIIVGQTTLKPTTSSNIFNSLYGFDQTTVMTSTERGMRSSTGHEEATSNVWTENITFITEVGTWSRFVTDVYDKKTEIISNTAGRCLMCPIYSITLQSIVAICSYS